MGPIHSAADLIDLLRRRALLILAVIALGSAVSLVLAARHQHIYESVEVLQIERPKIATELAPSTVEASAARRMQLIEQQLMARGHLLEMIERFGLFDDLAGLTDIEKVDLLRRSVTIEGVASVREGYADDGAISILRFSARLGDRVQAQQVAHALAAQTIALSERSRNEQTRGTLDFFVAEEQRLTAEIAALEARIAEFRAGNDLSIDGSLEFRRTQIATLNAAMLDIDRQMIAGQQELDNVDRTARQSTVDREVARLTAALASLSEQRLLLESRLQALAAVIDTSPEVERELGSYERALQGLQGQLDVILTRRSEAEVGYRLESNLQAERISVLEPARLPDYAITSSRKKLALMGLAASIAAALGLALALDWLHPTLRSSAQMQRETGLRPVVTIPFLDTRDPPTRILRRLWSRLRLQS